MKLPEGEDENEWYAVNSKHSSKQGAAARATMPSPMLTIGSGGFLQPDQPAIWRHH